ncbi:2,3-bisphosphoglycerate-independent phosphoglycerate mutase [Aequorivita echinoideorum]|uniref:2,3-bisphosphoglycerate-independent phosphoglycerate mutase n=1 Tax=Aequorivita echinoideorum TaxID=1549647 RepID=A0ABS5S7E4_9FLAO|nr:2,3-bisphosphoglycerate-independent phosphoglycerate mutase [Aequorivita echinoideorum]MBT0609118.1 2,3-bisphosphoglycerate-independent phosphoglycerate mutase [Aequorivita echinoideorum]
MNKKVILMILDGWGITQDPAVSAIAQANTPFIDSLYKKYPHGQLLTHGMNVGLPNGQMGNSEVGHMNLGAGRIIYQDLAKINMAMEKGTLRNEEALQKAFRYAKSHNKKVHFLGLLSDGGVHSHIDHLKGLLKAAQLEGISDMYVHAFTDGRDVDPRSGAGFVAEIQQELMNTGGKLASVIGRYFAMDRDRRWERVKKAYDLLCFGKGKASTNAIKNIEESYAEGITDEFIEPIVMVNADSTLVATIEKDDVVLFFNFRTDRGRQLTEVLTQKDYEEFGMNTLPLYFVTLTNYDDSFGNIHVVYNKENLKETLGEILEKNGKKQIRIAETEKYPHVTFFFSGGRELAFEGEKRILCPSPKVATYDLKPEMSAFSLRDMILPEIEDGNADFICMNFANPDMVGHTGVFEAAIKACEAVDKCAEAVIAKATEHNYTAIIIADHGNSECMRNPDGSPNTAHTTNPVPIILVDSEITSIKDGILGDVAPTILKLMGIDQPEIMTQKPLI